MKHILGAAALAILTATAVSAWGENAPSPSAAAHNLAQLDRPQRNPSAAASSTSQRIELQPISTDRPVASQELPAATRDITVMSMNVYLGANVVPALEAALTGCPALIRTTVTRLWRDVRDTNFCERAEVIARAMAACRPDLVGLQEVMLYRTGEPDSLQGNPTAAAHVELDFLGILLGRLDACGARYTPLAVTAQTDLELPGYIASADPCGRRVLRDIRLTDHVVILIRDDLLESGVRVGDVRGGCFQSDMRLPLGLRGHSLRIQRGWNSVDVGWEELEFRFVNMCLEVGNLPRFRRIQTRQAEELLRGPIRTSLPVILVGDSNSPSDRARAPTYERLLCGGLHDAWIHTHSGQAGHTYGNRPDLRNPLPMSYHRARFDMVLYRGAFCATDARLVGVTPAERTACGMFPSDHAGIVATLRATTFAAQIGDEASLGQRGDRDAYR